MKNKNLLNLSKSLPGKLLLTLALVIGWGSSVWAQKSLPYSYGFENNDLAGEGWTKSCETIPTNGGSDGSGIYSSQSYPGHSNSTYSYRFYGNTVNQYLISPELATSATGINVSFYYNSFSGTQSRTFNVGYSTTDSEVSSFTWLTNDITYTENGWLQFQESFPTTTKYIAIRHKANSQYQPFFIDDFSVEASEAYKKPKNLVVSSFTSNTATLSWTNGGDETAWQIAYSTKENFDPATEGVKVDVTTNPYTLSGLIDNVTYYAYVRSNYNGNYSNWSDNNVNFTPLAVETINSSGSNTSASIPIIDRTYSNDYMQTQFIIPASDANLSRIQNSIITKLTFYCSQSSINWNGATFEVYMNEVDKTAYSGGSASLELFTDWGTKVFNSRALSVSNGQMVIELNTPFTYTTGNLMIGFKQTHISGTENNTTSIGSTWYGTNQANYSDYTGIYYGMGYSSVSTSRANFIPKVTFTTISSSIPVTLGTNGYTTFACPRALDLTAVNLPSGLKAYKAAVSGTTVNFKEINQAVPANTGILLEGTAGTTYAIPMADSGTTPDGNAFEVNSTGGTFTAESGYTYYGLKKNSDPLVFATFDPATVAIPTNKAYQIGRAHV